MAMNVHIHLGSHHMSTEERRIRQITDRAAQGVSLPPRQRPCLSYLIQNELSADESSNELHIAPRQIAGWDARTAGDVRLWLRLAFFGNSYTSPYGNCSPLMF